jgi:hypothetical protein
VDPEHDAEALWRAYARSRLAFEADHSELNLHRALLAFGVFVRRFSPAEAVDLIELWRQNLERTMRNG